MKNTQRPARLRLPVPAKAVAPEAEVPTETTATAAAVAAARDFNPSISNHPDLPAINWAATGQSAPQLPDTPAGELPLADAVVITWAEAEWAAMQHVFCNSGEAMPYSSRNTGAWPGWQKYTGDIPTDKGSGWTYWGYFRLVLLGSRRVLLFKSNTHLDFPGAVYLTQLIGRFIDVCKPGLILSIGTAGGAMPSNHIGTVNAVHAGTLYAAGQSPSQWKTYSNTWQAGWQLIAQPAFRQLLVPIPTTTTDIGTLVSQFNTFYKTSYTEADLNIDNLNMGDKVPLLRDMTDTSTSLLTTSTFVVGTSAGNYQTFACVEMDDAVIAQACEASSTPFCFIRNISDPVQNAALPDKVQADWGSAIYDAYGFYTSVNGALAAWGVLSSDTLSSQTF